MTVFLCAKCSHELTPELTALPAVPEGPADDARKRGAHLAPSTVPRGHYAIEPEPWGTPFVRQKDQKNPVECQPRGGCWADQEGFLVSAGPRNTVVIHPDDAPSLQALPGRVSVGCCGPAGRYGPNHACACGLALATLAADCMGPYELHLDPLRVYPLD